MSDMIRLSSQDWENLEELAYRFADRLASRLADEFAERGLAVARWPDEQEDDE